MATTYFCQDLVFLIKADFPWLWTETTIWVFMILCVFYAGIRIFKSMEHDAVVRELRSLTFRETPEELARARIKRVKEEAIFDLEFQAKEDGPPPHDKSACRCCAGKSCGSLDDWRRRVECDCCDMVLWQNRATAAGWSPPVDNSRTL